MKEENSNNIIEEKKYKIITDKNNEMELYLRNINNEELSITFYTINQIPSKKYELKCGLEEFQKNRFFKIFINIDEIIRELNNKIEKSTFLEETNLIIIDIQIGLTIINEILLEIKEIKKNKDEIINELIIRNKEMEQKINELYKYKQETEKIISELNKKNKEMENNLFDYDSNIISKGIQLNFVLKQIYINNNVQSNRKCNLNLIYRATRDGDDASTYHKKTNYVPDTLTLIRTKDGFIFGGFTHIQIPNSSGANYDDDKAFVFSLDYNKIYLHQKGHCSKHSNDGNGPIFGNNQRGYPILIDNSSHFLKSSGHYTCTKNCTYDNFSFDYELNKGKKNFEVNEIEVYKVNFE